jgi:hypothetical protein
MLFLYDIRAKVIAVRVGELPNSACHVGHIELLASAIILLSTTLLS